MQMTYGGTSVQMSLLTDCLAAGGTIAIAVGSGFQAISELRRYGATARKLGLTRAANAAKELLEAQWRVSGASLLPFSLWPRFSFSIWKYPTNLVQYVRAAAEYIIALRAIGSEELTEHFTADDKIQVRELSLKSLYWALIMIGTLIVFAGAVVVIVSDLRQGT